MAIHVRPPIRLVCKVFITARLLKVAHSKASVVNTSVLGVLLGPRRLLLERSIKVSKALRLPKTGAPTPSTPQLGEDCPAWYIVGSLSRRKALLWYI